MHFDGEKAGLMNEQLSAESNNFHQQPLTDVVEQSSETFVFRKCHFAIAAGYARNFVFMLCLMLVYHLIQLFFDDMPAVIQWVFVFLILLTLIDIAFLLPSSRKWRCILAGDEVSTHTYSRFMFEEHGYVHASRIQRIEVDRGPLQILLGLSTISIYTAGNGGVLSIEDLCNTEVDSVVDSVNLMIARHSNEKRQSVVAGG